MAAEKHFETFMQPAPDRRCSSCGSSENVLAVKGSATHAYCVLCLYMALDVAMDWNMIGSVTHAMAIRKVAVLMQEERHNIAEKVERAISGRSRH